LAEFEARLLLAQGWVDLSLGRSEAGLEAFQASQRAADLLPGEGVKLHIEAGWGVIDAYRRLGRLKDAEAAHETTARLSETQPDLPKRFVAWNEANAMEFDFAVGRYSRVAARMEGAIRNCDRSFGPGSDLCRRVFIKSMQTKVRLGRQAVTPAEWSRLESIALDDTAPFQAFEATVVLFRAGEMAGGAGSRWQERMLVLTGPDSKSTLSPPFRAHVLALLADADLRADRAEAAAGRAHAAIAALGGKAAPPSRHTAYPRLLAGVAALRLGDASTGLSMMQQARDDAGRSLAPDHPFIALCDLTIAIAQYRDGDRLGALARWDGAGQRLRESFGPDSALYADYLRLRAEIDSGLLPKTGRVPFFA
jgi:hypothetical protein